MSKKPLAPHVAGSIQAAKEGSDARTVAPHVQAAIQAVTAARPPAPHVVGAIQAAKAGSDARTAAAHVQAAIQAARRVPPVAKPTQDSRPADESPAAPLQPAVQPSTSSVPTAKTPRVAAQVAQLATAPRRSTRRDAGLRRSPRIEELDRKRSSGRTRRVRNWVQGPYRAPMREEKKPRNLWNERRPQFEEATWTTMLARVPCRVQNGVGLYRCPECKNEVPRKRDLNRLKINDIQTLTGVAKDTRERKSDFIARLNVVSLDHRTDWKQYIWSNAEPTSTGEITKAAAKVAYNDTDNLQVMCKSCNSSKNGPKGVYD